MQTSKIEKIRSTSYGKTMVNRNMLLRSSKCVYYSCCKQLTLNKMFVVGFF